METDRSQDRLTIRVDASNPDHHLVLQGGVWHVRYTVRGRDGISRRIQRTLLTGSVQEARRRRDLLFEELDEPPSIARCSFAEADSPDSAWNRTASLDEQLDPFCCRTEWQLSYHEAMAPQRSIQIYQCGDSVIAFALRFAATLGPLLEPVEAGWLFGSPLLGPEALDLLDFLAARSPKASLLVSGLAPGSERFHRLVARFCDRYRLFRSDHDVLCSASLEGGFDGYLSRRSGKLRRNLRQAARRAAEHGIHYERHSPRTPEQVREVYRRILAVERTSWKGIGRCGMAEQPSREFYGRMLRRLAIGGNARVIFARRDERDIGFIFGGRCGPFYRGQQFSFDQEWREHSIGNLLQIEQLQWLCEEGAERYDMGPKMDYKRHWTEIERPIEAMLLQPR